MKKPQRSSSSMFRCAPLLAALILAGGCAVGPDFRAPAPEAPADFSAWHGGSAELLDAQARDAAGAPLGWSAFGDPVLDALMAKALAANHDLQTAALHFAQSRVQRQQAEAQRGPQLNASAAVSARARSAPARV
jgi:outer membrane protein TolC